MKRLGRLTARKLLVTPLLLLLVAAGGASAIPFTNCGPFTDVGTLICPFVLELYYSGITAGTSATTFSPNAPVTRGQMAVFTSTALDLSLARSSRRAALGQWWTTQGEVNLGITALGGLPNQVRSDGADLWVANITGYVSRVRASDGKLLETWTAPGGLGHGILVAMGRVFVADASNLYMIDPSQAPGPLTTVATGLGNNPADIAFDGSNIWTSNNGNGSGGSVSIITPGPSLPWSVTTVTQGFGGGAILFDGSNIWGVDGNNLLKLDSSGNILQTIPVGNGAQSLTFDGKNIWVPYAPSPPVGSILVVRASTGAIVATLSAPGYFPGAAAFDGVRVLVATFGGSIAIWKAADLTPIGSIYSFNTQNIFPEGVCSDGTNFWIAGIGSPNGGNGVLARF